MPALKGTGHSLLPQSRAASLFELCRVFGTLQQLGAFSLQLHAGCAGVPVEDSLLAMLRIQVFALRAQLAVSICRLEARPASSSGGKREVMLGFCNEGLPKIDVELLLVVSPPSRVTDTVFLAQPICQCVYGLRFRLQFHLRSWALEP